jgi:nucleoside 2-deoxyribosyltransferase
MIIIEFKYIKRQIIICNMVQEHIDLFEVIRMKKIYVAGPLFSIHERKFLEYMVKYLSNENANLNEERDFFLPHRDAGDLGIAGEKHEIFSLDVRHLDEADTIIAVLDGVDVDSGTAIELGYAFAKKKKIFGILTDHRAFKHNEIVHLNNMVWGVCNEGKDLILMNDLDDLKELSIKLRNHLEGIIPG